MVIGGEPIAVFSMTSTKMMNLDEARRHKTPWPGFATIPGCESYMSVVRVTGIAEVRADNGATEIKEGAKIEGSRRLTATEQSKLLTLYPRIKDVVRECF